MRGLMQDWPLLCHRIIEHAATLNVMEGEETSRHSIVYPGVYLCRFEHHTTVHPIANC